MLQIGANGMVVIIAIPGFPAESVLAGLMIGVLLVVLIRSIRKKSFNLERHG